VQGVLIFYRPQVAELWVYCAARFEEQFTLLFTIARSQVFQGECFLLALLSWRLRGILEGGQLYVLERTVDLFNTLLVGQVLETDEFLLFVVLHQDEFHPSALLSKII
jgi:hypothetical protein